MSDILIFRYSKGLFTSGDATAHQQRSSLRQGIDKSHRIFTPDAMRFTLTREYANLVGALSSTVSGIAALVSSGFFGYDIRSCFPFNDSY